MLEHYFQCPYCWENISMLLDISQQQSYVEDCEVCCNPIEVSITVKNNKLVAFQAKHLEQ